MSDHVDPNLAIGSNLRSQLAVSADKSAALLVSVVMGSKNDWPTMQHAAAILESFGVAFEARVVSAHRTPDLLHEYGHSAATRGIKVIIAGAGGAAHLPGMLAALTPIPVMGVPIKSSTLNGVDSLLSIIQMPKGVPVATFAIGDAGAANAALTAVAILALSDSTLATKLDEYRAQQTQAVLEQADPRT
jgi:5-(carboxyamino)imidazole ribonucleotide mutase